MDSQPAYNILIADSGSTKTEWLIFNFANPKEVRETFRTRGLNPFFVSTGEIFQVIKTEILQDSKMAPDVQEVHFYGAGCLPEKIPLVTSALSECFPAAKIEVVSDMLAAARSLLQYGSGVACILGTGSNTCFYEKGQITKQVPPLGYLLGDEGSGATMGRFLVVDYLREVMPEGLRAKFVEKFPGINKAEVLENVYNKPKPNTYLAGFTTFLTDFENEEYIKGVVRRSLENLFKNVIVLYEEHKNYPVCFIGSIAHHFRADLEMVAKGYEVTIGDVVSSPMEGLLKYHSVKIDK